MTDVPPIVVNIDSIEAIERLLGERWGGQYKPLTPSMRPRGGSLGINLMQIPPGRSACPFHSHQREDEAFFVLKGRGVLRYGDEIIPLRAGDCVSCPAGTGMAHQIANPYDDEDLVYLAIGAHDRDEVCVYPDSGKVLVRSLEALGRLEKADYFEGEPRPPRIFELAVGEAGVVGGGEGGFDLAGDEAEADAVRQRIFELSGNKGEEEAGEEELVESAADEGEEAAGEEELVESAEGEAEADAVRKRLFELARSEARAELEEGLGESAEGEAEADAVRKRLFELARSEVKAEAGEGRAGDEAEVDAGEERFIGLTGEDDAEIGEERLIELAGEPEADGGDEWPPER